MKKILLLLASAFLLFTGCANPTHVYHPLDFPEQSKGEIVKYEGVQIEMKSRDIAFESKKSDSLMLFKTSEFCYDSQNDYLVFPRNKNGLNITSRGYYFIVPRDSVTLCRYGEVKNNSYFSRNHMLHGAAIGAAILGVVGAVSALGTMPIVLFYSEGAGFGSFFWGITGLSALTGGILGFTIDSAIHIENPVEDVKETCAAYFTEEELKEYLENNLCY